MTRGLFTVHLSRKARLRIRLHMVRWWLQDRMHVGRFGLCPGCRTWRTDILRRRQLTQYTDDASNWVTQCADCQAYADKYWEDRWQEYYSGLL